MKIHVTDPIFIIAHHIISSAFAQMLCQLSVYTYLRFIQVHVYVLYLHTYIIYIYKCGCGIRDICDIRDICIHMLHMCVCARAVFVSGSVL
jgi:hypothetical protein